MAKKTKTDTKAKAVEVVKVKAEKETPAPNRIRMLMSLANADSSFTMGHSYDVPKEIAVNTARNWIACGAAEEDKSLDVPKETK